MATWQRISIRLGRNRSRRLLFRPEYLWINPGLIYKEFPLPSSGKMHLKCGKCLGSSQHLKQIYTSSLAFEFGHVHDEQERLWLQEKVETRNRLLLCSRRKNPASPPLLQVEGFETFLQQTFAGQKRFGIEGIDAIVPMLDEMVRLGSDDGSAILKSVWPTVDDSMCWPMFWASLMNLFFQNFIMRPIKNWFPRKVQRN